MFSIKINNVDFSRLVAKPVTVPYSKRNRDFTLIANEFDVTFLENVTNLNEGDGVGIYKDNFPLFSGYVSKFRNEKDSHYNIATVTSKLAYLKKVKVDYDTLHQHFVNTSEDWEYNPQGAGVIGDNCASVNLFKVVRSIFDKAYLTLNTDAVTDRNSKAWIEKIHWAGADYDIYLTDLYLSEDMLWCVNNDVATKHENIESDFNKRNRTYNGFDFVSEVCSNLGLYIYYDGVFRLMTEDDFKGNAINQRDYWSYNEDVREQSEGYSYHVRFKDNINSYKSSTESSLDEIQKKEIDGGSEIVTVPNLVYLYRKPNTSDGSTLGVSDVGSTVSKFGQRYLYPFDGNKKSMLTKKKLANYERLAIKNYSLSFDNSRLAVESHSIDIGSQVSNITEVV